MNGQTKWQAVPRPTDTSPTYDVVVIGGGVFGMFACLDLAAKGKTAVLIDRDTLWCEASAVNAGTLAVQNKLPALVPYALWALDIWRTLEGRLGAPIGLRRTGGYKVALSDADANRLERVARAQEEKGLEVRRLDTEALRKQSPWISKEVVICNLLPA